MKGQLARWLAALVIAALLLAPAAMAEDNAEGESLAAEPAFAAEEGAPEPSEASGDAVDAEDAVDDGFDAEVAPQAVDAAIEEADAVDLDAGDEPDLSLAEAAEALTAPLYEELPNTGEVTLSAADIPDANFWSYLIRTFNTDDDADTLSPDEIRAVTYIDIKGEYGQLPDGGMGYGGMGIASLKGIGYFTNLDSLHCNGNALTTLDLSGNTKLTFLDCSDSRLTELNVGHCAELKDLRCINNQLKALNVGNCPKLNTLLAHDNGFTELDVSNCPNLVALVADDSRLMKGISSFWYSDPDTHMMILSFDQKVKLKAGGKIIQNTDIPIDAAHFPDPVFRDCVAKNKDWDHNGYLSDEERLHGSIPLEGLSIGSLQGIEYFENLEVLNINNSTVSSVDLRSFRKLSDISIINSTVGELNVSGNASLSAIHCTQAQVTTIDASDCINLKTFGHFETQISTLDLSRCTSLEWLYFPKNIITCNITGCTNLNQLYCSGASLTALDLSGCTNLTLLSCPYNQLTSLDLSGFTKLKKLECSDNRLSTLNIDGCTSLEYIYCYKNNLTTLDVSNCPGYATLLRNGYGGTHDDQRYYQRAIESGPGYLCCDINVEIKGIFPPVSANGSETVTATQKSTKTTVTALPGASTQLETGAAAGTQFKSSNKKVATVDQNGNVTFKKAGKVKITFTADKQKKTLVLTVKDPTIPQKIGISLFGPQEPESAPTSAAPQMSGGTAGGDLWRADSGKAVTVMKSQVAKVGEKRQADVMLPGGTYSAVKWSSSNKKVATVKNGMVTFKKAGKVTITATAVRGKKKARITFKVTK